MILNPAASKGSGRSKYDKYCAPILHLAGLTVDVIRTESEGEAKDLMERMTQVDEAYSDVVLVAGGDGTVMETVTGICRRRENDSKIQIGVLAVGRHNMLAKRLFPVTSQKGDEVEMMAKA